MIKSILRCKTYSKYRKLRLNFVRWSFLFIFAAMIQELPKYKDSTAYYSEPLLEYVVNFAQKEWPYQSRKNRPHNPSSVPVIFCKRLFAGKIKMQDIILQRFMEADEVRGTINAYGIDINKFFYLCLLLKDYSEGQTIDSAKENPTHREELEMLVNELSQMLPQTPKDLKSRLRMTGPARYLSPKVISLSDNLIKTDITGEITIKIGGGRKRIIRDSQTLIIIKEAISSLLSRAFGYNPYLDNAPLRPSKTSDLPQIYRVALFYQYMKQFLRPFTCKKTEDTSIDKTLLISRLIYVFALSNDKRYYDKTVTKSNSKKSFLKSNLSHYTNIKIPVDNKYYPR